jgi:hypothetical protein
MDALPLLRPPDVDLSSGQLFRVLSARAVATIAIVMGVLVAACIWIGWRGGVVFGGRGVIPAVLAWWIVFWLGLFLLLYANDWRKALKPGAWLALATADGVYIKYRSYRNLSRNQDAPQVVFVPYQVIESARIDRHTWLTPESQSRDTRSERLTFVELELADMDLSELEQRLADERTGKPGRSARGTKTWRHFPVSVEAGNVVRVECGVLFPAPLRSSNISRRMACSSQRRQRPQRICAMRPTKISCRSWRVEDRRWT